MGIRDNTLVWLVEPECRHRLLHRRMTVEFWLVQYLGSLALLLDLTNGIRIRQVRDVYNQGTSVDIFLQLFYNSLFHHWLCGLADSAHGFLCESGTHSRHRRHMTRSYPHNQRKPVSTQDPLTYHFGPASRSETYRCYIRTYEEFVISKQKYEVLCNDRTFYLNQEMKSWSSRSLSTSYGVGSFILRQNW
jgi:hypothetical protein